MIAPVTIVTPVWGNHSCYLPAWENAVQALDPAPAEIIVSADLDCSWRYPQAFYQQAGAELATTDWVLFADVDDFLYLDALAGIEDVDADVWQLGFDRSDGERYVPPQLTGHHFLSLDHNPFVGSSAVRLESFRAVGGFHDIALQDYGLWRRMAHAGMTFESSGRTHFLYNRHSGARGETELTPEARPAHMTEMMETELAAV